MGGLFCGSCEQAVAGQTTAQKSDWGHRVGTWKSWDEQQSLQGKGRGCGEMRAARNAQSAVLTSHRNADKSALAQRVAYRHSVRPQQKTRHRNKKSSLTLLSSWCPGPGSNRHGCLVRGILSPLCLPISPPGLVLSVPDNSGYYRDFSWQCKS